MKGIMPLRFCGHQLTDSISSNQSLLVALTVFGPLKKILCLVVFCWECFFPPVKLLTDLQVPTVPSFTTTSISWTSRWVASKFVDAASRTLRHIFWQVTWSSWGIQGETPKKELALLRASCVIYFITIFHGKKWLAGWFFLGGWSRAPPLLWVLFQCPERFFFWGGVVIFGSHKSRHCFVFLFWHSGSC